MLDTGKGKETTMNIVHRKGTTGREDQKKHAE